MTEMDYSALGKAIERLRESLAAHRERPGDTLVRDSVIKRFEFTFELSHKMLRRFLMESMASAGAASEMTFPTLIRTANEYGLLRSDWPQWKEFREARNETIHAYQEEKAVLVAEVAAEFLPEAEFLYTKIKEERA